VNDSPRITCSIPHSIVGAVAIAAVALGLAAPSASADSNLGSAGGFTYIQSDSVSLSAGEAGLPVADCPGGTKVVGGGVTPQSSPAVESRISSTYPIDTGDADSKTDNAWEGDVYNVSGAQKAYSAYAICKRSGPVKYGVKKVTGVPPSGSRTATVKCPEGTRVAGGGLFVGGVPAQGYVNRTYPIDGGDPDSKPDDGWRGRGYNLATGNTNVRAHVTCIDARLRYALNLGSFTDCPDGTHATGGGAAIPGSAASSWLNTLYPFAYVTTPPDDGFVNLFNAPPGALATGYAICK
jgi:hypothetical protein